MERIKGDELHCDPFHMQIDGQRIESKIKIVWMEH